MNKKKKWIFTLLISFSLLIISIPILLYVDSQKGGRLSNMLNGFENSATLNNQENYGVSSSNKLAVQVGMEVLEAGGNAVDAAVAVSYALNVVEPYGSGIGGGGGMLIVPKNKKDAVFFDYRETSSKWSPLQSERIGIPGFVLGMEKVHDQYGKMPMKDLIEPAITLAEKGFKVGSSLVARLSEAKNRLSIEALEHFYPNGQVIEEGATLKQAELAATLRNIQEYGSETFYQTFIAEKIAEAVDGIDVKELSSYDIAVRKPLYGTFLDYQVVSAPPPFSGMTVIQSFMLAERSNAANVVEDQVEYIHQLGQITNLSYDDTFKYIGDPAFNTINYQELLESDYIEEKLAGFDERKSVDFKGEDHVSTTHFVVTDKEGTMVSVTNTLSNYFGSGKYIDGFFLNNSLRNFIQDSDGVNQYEPGKRSRTFTAPTVLWNDDSVIGIGSPGGRRIPMMIVDVSLRHLQNKEQLQKAINKPRFFVENNTILTEEKLPSAVKAKLQEKKYNVIRKKSPEFYGGVQAMVVDYRENKIYGGADKRRQGSWKVK